MVKKRLNKKYAREVSDESDSDDFLEDETPEVDQPKKYSLRQRRSANFAEDFDYDLVEDAANNLAESNEVLRSDDEDFDLKETEEEEGTTSKPQSSRISSRPKKTQKADLDIPNCTITKYKDRELEPAIPTDRQSSEDMIDFEDVIRADILVNKSRIDYDSIIEKTEIKIEKRRPEENVHKEEKLPKNKSKVTQVKCNKNGEPAKKRGRKPKKQKLEDDCYENESYAEESDNVGVGLPINTVLGVSESLYELAERYHMQGGDFVEEMVSLPTEPLIKEHLSTESTESGFIENETDCKVALPEPEAVTEAIQSF